MVSDGQRDAKGFLQCGVVMLHIWPIYHPDHSNDVCMGFDFAGGDIVLGCYKHIYYHVGYEGLICVVIMGWWVSYVVEEKIYYVVEAICELECIRWERFGVFRGNQKYM